MEALETFATSRPRRGQSMAAAALCIAVSVLNIALLPWAGGQMPAIPAFLPINQCALFCVYGLTAWLFLAQYRRTLTASVLVLGAGSLYTTWIVLAQLVCFPDVMAPGLLLGHGAATLTWLWSFWHFGMPAVALIYAIMERGADRRAAGTRHASAMLWLTVAATTVATGLTVWFVCDGLPLLPDVADVDGGYWTLTTSGIGPALCALTAVALAVLCWRTRLRSVLQLWLGVSLVFLLLDNIVTDIGAARATIGWFAGRLDALLAGWVVLGVYLNEFNALYHRAEQAAIEREQALLQAQTARDNLELALDASGMGDWELDLRADRSRRTLRHDRLFGYSEMLEAWGKDRFMQHVVLEDRPNVQAAFDDALRTGRLHVECRIRRADTGAVRWIEVYGRASYGEDGKPASLAGCLMDVTERRQTEERLRQAGRMEAIGQLTGGVAHDFNNLLTVVLSSLDLIVRRPQDATRVERLARNALVAGRRGTDLTDKLLAFSRRQLLRPETVNLNRFVAEFLPMLQRAVGETVEIVVDLDPGLDPARLDQTQFQAALLNIAVNSSHAMPSGGHLRIETHNVTLRGDEVDNVDLEPGAYVQVSVHDTGIGMDAATSARAFEPFFTTKEVGKGTGLGLSQVYGFARQAGGTCRVWSAPGQGCRVDLFLPRSAEAVAKPRVSSNVVPLRQAKGHEVVLVVEDEDTVREMAAESLNALGYQVLTAPDARVALDVVRGPSRVDILFSDVVMPGGMNGAQLGNEARKIRPQLKVLLTSGYMETATGGTRDLPDDVKLLRKPYLREDLATTLQTVLYG